MEQPLYNFFLLRSSTYANRPVGWVRSLEAGALYHASNRLLDHFHAHARQNDLFYCRLTGDIFLRRLWRFKDMSNGPASHRAGCWLELQPFSIALFSNIISAAMKRRFGRSVQQQVENQPSQAE